VAAILMATAAAVTYWRTTAPPETVKLAVESTLPLGAALQEVKGTPQRGFTVTGNRGRATHVLTVRTEARDTGQMVSVQLTDTRNQARLATWEGVYDANEMAHAPAGVAGVASAALHVEPRPATTAFHSAEALTWYETALALLRQDDRIDDALVLLERAAAEEPSSGLPLAGIAEGAYRKYVLTNAAEWLERSKEAVRRAALRGQDSAPVHRIAGLLLANEGQFAPAIARYQRATELSATNSDAWRRLGEAYQRVNQLDQALAALEHAVEIEPEYYRTHQDLGGYFINRGNYTAAIPELRRAVELAPENPTLRSALATALKNIGEFAAAEKELRFGLTLREEPRVLHALGQVLMYESRESEAIPYFRRALEKDQSRFLSWLYLGNCLLRTKQVAEARAAYQQGLATVEPLVIDQQDGRRRAFLAYLCARLGDAHRAEVEIAQALGATPDGADAQWMAALTYEVLGKRDEALRVLRSAPPELLADLARWPEAADLTHDERFSKMLPTPGKSP
jgi:serine/threonine-protein kinase